MLYRIATVMAATGIGIAALAAPAAAQTAPTDPPLINQVLQDVLNYDKSLIVY
ncbi:hypothetical protein ACBJ59_00750 [Nonomuraea sp. MTCD27]|uniref:hypothetical protein n=1 Tax=Nonomuraea sp. MTCD27 TaxID=1676747 RepID=UPI0035C23D1F